MSFDIEKAIKYPFEDPNWKRKFGIYLAVQLVIGIAVSALNALSNITPYLQSSTDSLTAYTSTTASLEMAQILTYLAPTIALLIVMVVSLPVQLYLSGYRYMTLRSVQEGSEYPLPEHNDFLGKLKMWFDVAVVQAGPFILNMIMFTIVTIPLIFLYAGVFTQGEAAAESPLLLLTIVATLVAIVILIAASIFTGMLVSPAMLYIYFRTGSRSRAYAIGDVLTVISAGWQRFILISLITLAVSMVAGFLGVIACFVSFIVKPILTSIQDFMSMYFLGSVFSELDAEKVLGNGEDVMNL